MLGILRDFKLSWSCGDRHTQFSILSIHWREGVPQFSEHVLSWVCSGGRKLADLVEWTCWSILCIIVEPNNWNLDAYSVNANKSDEC